MAVALPRAPRLKVGDPQETLPPPYVPQAKAEPCSKMSVVGAPFGDFSYGKGAGAAGAFKARLHHASVKPESPEEHLKVAFFFRLASP